ncbi:hypothetical protein GTGU_00605 [Trabulsiella guamensis ATCC 49490]|uniref:Rhs family protein n=1 Tax=Trabulsiella guamensis ATCC 49490 TaxID=1005994 RepID=A0A085AK10_9ENTR|nr:RHS repeat-associated core domain-containing protein [Trabulsiella guamensis]KFC10555.1 hypothetical protein GTGU_00605 [Trabulsiella guamensis ATCC 49490]
MALQLSGNDWHGSPLLSRTSGTNTSHTWSPFGAGTITSLPGFNGERQDPLSGVTHLGNGYRAYSPILRRFTCPDSESPFGIGGINPYAYCESDPINQTDPSGHGPITWLLRKIIGVSIRIGIKAAMSDSMSATIATLSTVETGVEAAASLATGVAAKEMAEKDPAMARKLGWASMGLGIAATFGIAEKLAPRIGQKLEGISGKMKRVLPGNNRRTLSLGGPMRNTRIHQGNYTGLMTYEDVYKGSPRLNILSHGALQGNTGTSLLAVDNQRLTPRQLQLLLQRKGINIQSYDNVRLLSCYSANGGESSFAAQFSGLIHRPVKGFEGVLNGSIGPRELTEQMNFITDRYGSEWLSHYFEATPSAQFSVHKWRRICNCFSQDWDIPGYRPVTFSN